MTLKELKSVLLSYYNNKLIIVDKNYQKIDEILLKNYEIYDKYKNYIVEEIDTTCEALKSFHDLIIRTKLIITIFKSEE